MVSVETFYSIIQDEESLPARYEDLKEDRKANVVTAVIEFDSVENFLVSANLLNSPVYIRMNYWLFIRIVTT